MSITGILSKLGYSEEFIRLIENSVEDNQYIEVNTKYGEQVLKSYDSDSCFLEESNEPFVYSDFSNTNG